MNYPKDPKAFTDLEQRAAEWLETLSPGEAAYVVGHLTSAMHGAAGTPSDEGSLRIAVRVWSSIAEYAFRSLVGETGLKVDDSIHDPLVELLTSFSEAYVRRIGGAQ